MDDLQNATQIIKRLKKEAKIQMDAGYFSRKVTEGCIPNHSKEGSTKKFYLYHEVLEAIEDMKDPTRDPQREAIENKRQNKKRKDFEEFKTLVLNNQIQDDFFSNELIKQIPTQVTINEVETECIAAVEVNSRLKKARNTILELLQQMKDTGELNPHSNRNDELINLCVDHIFNGVCFTEKEIIESFTDAG